MRVFAILGAGAVLALAACDAKKDTGDLPIPGARGDMECYHLATDKYNEVGKAARVEDCAGMLEAVRVQGGRDQAKGAYQGAKVIVNQEGVFVSIKGTAAMPLLVRTEDGQLVPLGQVPGR